MSYNSQANSKMAKKSMYLKKSIDSDIPQNIMRLVNQWIDCYNDTIRERTKISMHYEFEEKINDTSCQTGTMKMSRSGQKSETERMKCEKDIFNWISSIYDDEKVDLYSTKLSEYMNINKETIINQYVNQSRILNKQKPFNPNYKKLIKSSEVKKDVKKEVKEEKKEYKTDANGKVLYGDAWDLI